MTQEFLNFIESSRLTNKDHSILIAISGGVDSIVMTHLFQSSGFRVSLAHCNFNLRGSESDKDEEFVVELAKRTGLKCFTKSFGTKSYATHQGISTQMAARELRYKWFEELIDQYHLDRLATAHHLDDSFETVLLNLVRGTGIAGITGISEQSGNIIRPLVHFTKEEILTYAKEHNLEWREDASNSSDDYKRNAIRLNVVPELKKLNPALLETFRATARRMKDTAELLKSEAKIVRQKNLIRKGADYYLNKKNVRSLNPIVLHELLSEFGFTYHDSNLIIDRITKTGLQFYSNQWVLNIDRDELILSPVDFQSSKIQVNQKDIEVKLPECLLTISTEDADPKKMINTDEGATFDFDRLSWPLTIRNWEEGDRFRPLGMTGQKKISDFMIDAKIPLNLKRRVYVMESNGEIVWIIGHRIDDRFKVTSSTKTYYQIRLNHAQSF